MKSLEEYFAKYGESHRHSSNLLLHKICVPLIMWSLLAFLHTFRIEDFHLSYILVVISLSFYAGLKRPLLFVLMLIVTLLMIATFAAIPHLRVVSLIVFALAWIGQFVGHHIEGKKPSFLDDLQFLLIGPAWILFQVPGLKKVLCKN